MWPGYINYMDFADFVRKGPRPMRTPKKGYRIKGTDIEVLSLASGEYIAPDGTRGSNVIVATRHLEEFTRTPVIPDEAIAIEIFDKASGRSIGFLARKGTEDAWGYSEMPLSELLKSRTYRFIREC